MLKAAFPMNIVPIALSFITIVLVIGFFYGYLQGLITSYAEFADSGAEKMNAIDAAHLIEDCFKGENDFVEWSFLTDNENKNVCEIEECQICAIDIGLKIKDLTKSEGKNEWSFGFDTSKGVDHHIFTNIKDGKEIHMGKIYVQII